MMKFIKSLSYDISYGIFARNFLNKLFVWILVLFLSCSQFCNDLIEHSFDKYTYGDYLLYIFGGIKEYIPSSSEPFQIPYLWFLINSLLLFFSLHYMYDDLFGFGQGLIYRSCNRASWWLSKCCHSILTVLLFYAISWGFIAVFCLALKGSLSLEVSDITLQVIDIGDNTYNPNDSTLAVEFFILLPLTSVAMSLLQMSLCLIIRPSLSYTFSIVVLLSSAYFISPCLMANYTMVIRNSKITNNGVATSTGICFSIALVLSAVILGYGLFKKYDILQIEHSL